MNEKRAFEADLQRAQELLDSARRDTALVSNLTLAILKTQDEYPDLTRDEAQTAVNRFVQILNETAYK